MAGRHLNKLSNWRVPHLRREIGAVFQDFRLLPNKTVFDNVAFALEVIGKKRHHVQSMVPETLELVGLAGKEKRLPHELSGGEQQRVAIARAVVNHPPILLCDEPTGNLDPGTSVGIMRLLDRINRTGTTVLMATHDDEIVDQMRKRVIELKGGQLIRDQDRGVYGAEAVRMRLRFIFGEVFNGLRRNGTMALSVVLVTFVSLTFVGAAALTQMQVDKLKDDWYGKVEVSVFLCPEQLAVHVQCAQGRATPAQEDADQGTSSKDGVGRRRSSRSRDYESREEAFKKLRARDTDNRFASAHRRSDAGELPRQAHRPRAVRGGRRCRQGPDGVDEVQGPARDLQGAVQPAQRGDARSPRDSRPSCCSRRCCSSPPRSA